MRTYRTLAKFLKEGDVFIFKDRKTKMLFIKDNRLTYSFKKYKSKTNHTIYESDYYNAIVDVFRK